MSREDIKEDLRKAYNEISRDFSSSRVYPWEELQVFISHFKEGFKVLDLGCGNGRLIKSLEQTGVKYEYLGVDFSEELLREAKQNFPSHKFMLADMTDIKFEHNSFDIVFMIASFHHVPTKEERLDLLYRINRWLKPGGYLFMTNWNLWQKKYIRYAVEKFWSKHSWNDFFIPWKADKKNTQWRFYHSFTTGELVYLLKKTHFDLKPEGVYKTRFNINCFVQKSKK